MNVANLSKLRSTFGKRMQENALLAGYTAARIGGPADVLLFAHSATELAETVKKLWELDVPFVILGGGSNVLVSDRGIRGVVIINRAKSVKFNSQSNPPYVHAESGVTPNDISQRAARLGLSGFEWAASVPGSLGGAIYGNAGAYDGNIAGNLSVVNLLHRQHGFVSWSVEKMDYGYRSSILKREHLPVVILSADLILSHGDKATIRSKMEKFSLQRRSSQPPGASMGSMFKNPPGDKAGRLIEAAGLKGRKIGNVSISTHHANFFISSNPRKEVRTDTEAADMRKLIELTQQMVLEHFGIKLELEVELIGEW